VCVLVCVCVFLCTAFPCDHLAALLAEIVVCRFRIFPLLLQSFFLIFLAELGGVENFLFAFSACCRRG
jgi:ABC-type amino acid transport system permease subunit